MADADQRPMWYAGDYFGETFPDATEGTRGKTTTLNLDA